MENNLGWILLVFAVLVIAFLYNKQNDNENTKTDEIKCELRDAYGRLITITGNSNDPQFQNMCKSQENQQVYVYGYPYYFVRYWSPVVWGGGRRWGGHKGK